MSQGWIHSGIPVAATAWVLTEAAAAAMGAPLPPTAAAVVFLGALAVYALDRLGDDGVDKPGRADLRRRHPRLLPVLAGVGGTGAVVLGLRLPFRAVAVLAAVVTLALAHRRLRHLPWVKPAYIALAWLAVVVGLPWSLSGADAATAVSEGLPLGLAISANVLGCDAADGEGEVRALGRRRIWHLARILAVAGVLVALAGVPSSRALGAVPAALGLALLPYRPDPQYAETVLDGALLAGGLVAWWGS